MLFTKLFQLGQKLYRQTQKYWRNVLSVGSILCISFSLLNLINTSFVLPVQATTTGVTGGNVSLNKYYFDGTNEVKTLVTAPGDYITVRLKYDNSSNASGTNVVLNDSLPGSKFSFIPGTLKNCLVSSANCTNLSDTLFTGLNLVTTPSAGFYSYANTAATGNLELGRYKYAHVVTCTQASGKNESFIQSVDNTSIFVPSCSAISGSSTVANYSTFPILGQRYIHLAVCLFGTGEKEIFTQSIDNNASFTPVCSSFSGSSVDSSSTLDLLANRYLHQTICTQSGGEKEIFTQSTDNNASFTASCASLGGSLTVDSSSTTDLYSASNAQGYIEYQMKSILNEDFNSSLNTDIGDYGTNASLVSPFLTNAVNSTLTDNMQNSLALKVYCDQINPTGGERNLSLSDAELRAGQDFRCNYQASICPVVFEDVNTNGKYDDGIDTLNSGVQVQLQSTNGATTYDTLTTTNTVQCIPNLLHGRNYKVNLSSPPTGISTTGGDSKNQLISYKTTTANVEFGYSNGSLVLNVPSYIALPALQVSNSVTPANGTITPIQVIDTRLANPGWTLTATVNDFVKTIDSNEKIVVTNQFRNTPASVTINTGQSGGISIGDQKTVNSTSDTMSIFRGNPGNSKGDYQINTDVTLFVPAFISAGLYRSTYIYTII
jgi:hypothetical protein